MRDYDISRITGLLGISFDLLKDLFKLDAKTIDLKNKIIEVV